MPDMIFKRSLILCFGLFCMSVFAYTQQPIKPVIEPVSGDVYNPDFRFGVVLTAPDGTCYRLRMANGGTIVTESVSCPNITDDCTTVFGCNLASPDINNGSPVTCNSVVTIDLNWVNCDNELITYPGQQGLTASIGQIAYVSTSGITNTYSWTIPSTSPAGQTVTFTYGDPNDLCSFSTIISPC